MDDYDDADGVEHDLQLAAQEGAEEERTLIAQFIRGRAAEIPLTSDDPLIYNTWVAVQAALTTVAEAIERG